jgi:predicted butyrate kinase (DUF1464 family)
VAREAYVEGAARAARQLRSAAPHADEIVLSGRMTSEPAVRDALRAALAELGEVRMLAGFASRAKQGAQGAALVADGLAGGTRGDLVDRLRIREARGTVLDDLHVITPAAALRRLGLRDG